MGLRYNEACSSVVGGFTAATKVGGAQYNEACRSVVGGVSAATKVGGAQWWEGFLQQLRWVGLE